MRVHQRSHTHSPTHNRPNRPTTHNAQQYSSCRVCSRVDTRTQCVRVIFFQPLEFVTKKGENNYGYTKIVLVWAHFDAPSSPNLAFMGPILALIRRRACVERACGRGGSGAFGGRRSSAGHTETGIVGKKSSIITTTLLNYIGQ